MEETAIISDETLSHEYSFAEYEKEAITTRMYPEKFLIIYPTIKLNGEAGEVAEKVGKIIRDKDCIFSDEDKIEIKKEMGDVMWYLAALSKDLGFTLSDVAKMNIEKLRSRRARGVVSGSGDNR